MSSNDELKSLGFQHINSVVNQSIAVVGQAQRGERKVFPTKWPRLNKQLLGGLQPGKLYVIGGRPGSGKSTFSNQMLFDMLDHPKNKDQLIVLYWSFEMPGYQQIMRAASAKQHMSLHELLSVESQLSDQNFGEFMKIVSNYKNYPVFFANKAVSVDEAVKKTKRIVALHPKHTVVNLFDHSRLFKGNESDELHRLTRLSHECIHLGREFDVINIILSQLNRNIETKERAANQYKPLQSDIFGADSIGQDAHAVMIINRPYDMYKIQTLYNGFNPQGLLALHLVKNRDGNIGMLPFDADMSKFDIQERLTKP